MTEEIYDIAVIGSGPAGEKAAIEAAQSGAKVVIIEKGTQPGGAAVITGTIPSKSLRETVKYVQLFSNQDISGIEHQLERPISIHELMHRKNVVVDQRVGDIMGCYAEENIDCVFGEASFISSEELVVKLKGAPDKRIRARKTIIAIGTTPYHPPDIIFDGEHILDSDTILSMKAIPESMVIYGGGVIGCEYASIFSLLGIKVHLVDTRGVLLDFLDHELSKIMADIMADSGISLHLGESYTTIAIENEDVVVQLDSGKELRAPVLLYANGRQGTANRLNLEACGLTMNSRYQLEVNHNYQTSVDNIYAVGDVVGVPSLVSVSNEEGRIAANHAVKGIKGKRVGADIPYGIYTIPEIALVGITENQLIERKIPYEKGICYFKDLARGLIIGDRRGLLKILFHKTSRKLLGVHICGQSAAELIHIGQAVMNHDGVVDYFLETVFNFPTLSSAYKVAARDGVNRLKKQ